MTVNAVKELTLQFKRAKEARADFDFVKPSRYKRTRTGLAPQGGSGDYHSRNTHEYYNGIELARDMMRNDAIVGQAVERAAQNIVQGGFSLDWRTKSKALNRLLRDMWNEWASDPEQCDLAGEMTFPEYELQSCTDMLGDGDCVITGTLDGPLQYFEGHNIFRRHPRQNTVLGVQLAPNARNYRKRQAYWVVRDDIDPRNTRKEISQPLAVRSEDGVRQVFHVYHRKRTTLTRGVTALAPIFNVAGMRDDIDFAKLVQQQVVSCFAIFFKRSHHVQGSIPSTDAGYGKTSTETDSEGTRIVDQVAPAMQVTGAPGEEIEGFSPNIPNPEYFDHYKLMITQIGINLGLPLVLVLFDSAATFHGHRTTLEEARRGFRSNQRNLMNRLHHPVVKWKLAQWLADSSKLRSDVARFGMTYKWTPPSWAYIDLLKDAQGNALRLKTNQTSPRRLLAETIGADWEDIVSETVEDNSLAIQAAIKEANKINDKFPDANVNYRELISPPLPDGIQMSLNHETANAEN